MSPFSEEYATTKYIQVATGAATAYTHEISAVTYILVINEGLWFGLPHAQHCKAPHAASPLLRRHLTNMWHKNQLPPAPRCRVLPDPLSRRLLTNPWHKSQLPTWQPPGEGQHRRQVKNHHLPTTPAPIQGLPTNSADAVQSNLRKLFPSVSFGQLSGKN